MRFMPIIALVFLGGCAPLDELIFGPPPQQQNPPASTAAPDGGHGDVPSPGPVGSCSREGFLVRLAREATRSIPWSGPAITLAVWLYVRLRRRTNQFKAVVTGIDTAVGNGDLTKDSLYMSIEAAARALTTLDEFRRIVGLIKSRREARSISKSDAVDSRS